MKLRLLKYLLLLCVWLGAFPFARAQPSLSIYLESGENNVSEGLFIRTAAFGEYRFGKNSLRGGLQLDLKGPGTKFLTGASINLAREFSIREFPFEIHALYSHNRFSELLYEYNLGVVCKVNIRNLTFRLGNNFRTYGLTKYAVREYAVDSDNKIHENFNLMYLVAYHLNPAEHYWNVSLSVTNIDHFIIEQETNPVLFLRGEYNISSPLTVFAELWYKTAGSFNLSINYFGFFFRTGLIWNINL
ncbi:MAG: hypothetical protein RQ743_02925 [Bacteroidales bacterium]|nr:hypothetical protein [Bacteroidales bacterium]